MKLFFICIFIVSTSCTHRSPEVFFNKKLDSLLCEEAFLEVPELKSSQQVIDSAEWLAKNSLAYTYVGINYSAQVIWDVSVGTVGFIALCGPMILVGTMADGTSHKSGGESIAHRQNDIYPTCIPAPEIAQKLFSPPLGKKALKSTHDFRCPNVENLALSIDKIASCYEKRAWLGDFEKALVTLQNIENSKHFYSCVSPQMQDQILSHRQQLENQQGVLNKQEVQ